MHWRLRWDTVELIQDMGLDTQFRFSVRRPNVVLLLFAI